MKIIKSQFSYRQQSQHSVLNLYITIVNKPDIWRVKCKKIKRNFVALFMHLGKSQFEYLAKYAFWHVPI